MVYRPYVAGLLPDSCRKVCHHLFHLHHQHTRLHHHNIDNNNSNNKANADTNADNNDHYHERSSPSLLHAPLLLAPRLEYHYPLIPTSIVNSEKKATHCHSRRYINRREIHERERATLAKREKRQLGMLFLSYKPEYMRRPAQPNQCTLLSFVAAVSHICFRCTASAPCPGLQHLLSPGKLQYCPPHARRIALWQDVRLASMDQDLYCLLLHL